MKRLGLVVLAVAVLAGMTGGQELTFGKYGIGVGYGNQYYLLNTVTPYTRMSGTSTDWVGGVGTTTNLYVDVLPMPNEQMVSTGVHFDATWRPIEALGVRAGVDYLLGNQSFKTSQTINETVVDTNGIFETTTTTTGSNGTEIKNKISGFPFAFSLVPSFKIGDKVLLQPEGGIAYYSVTQKGDKGTYSLDETVTVTDRNMNTNTTTTTTIRTSESASGKMPDVKYSGLGTFWGFEAQVLVHKNVAIRAGLRKGGANLKEKYTDSVTRYFPSGGQRWTRINDQTTYENSLHVATEAYGLGLVYNF
jgi:hypothetical protein